MGSLLDTISQEKTGERVWIPAHSHLKAVLAKVAKRHAIILTTPSGRPWRGTHYHNFVRETVEACGFKGYSLHGLRRNAVAGLMEAGCSTDETKSITGHKSDAMIRHYGQEASRKVMAKSAITKLEHSRNPK